MKFYRFTAKWCGPCKVLADLLDREELTSHFTVIDVDSLEGEELSRKYGITALPTLMSVDEDGKEVSRKVGIPRLAELEKWLNP
jgi:thioredoxin 1